MASFLCLRANAQILFSWKAVLPSKKDYFFLLLFWRQLYRVSYLFDTQLKEEIVIPKCYSFICKAKSCLLPGLSYTLPRLLPICQDTEQPESYALNPRRELMPVGWGRVIYSANNFSCNSYQLWNWLCLSGTIACYWFGPLSFY